MVMFGNKLANSSDPETLCCLNPRECLHFTLHCTITLWLAASKMAPMIPTSWWSPPVWSPPLEWGLDLVTCCWQTEHGRSDGISLPRLNSKDCYLNFAFSLAFLARSLWWGQMPCCELAYGETYKTKNKGRPLANSQQGTEALSPTAYQELKPAHNPLSELGSGSSPTWALRWL